MYGFKQAEILVYEQLCEKLYPAGYHPIIGSAGMLFHVSRPEKNCLCVNDFGFKYYNKSDAQHLIDTLGKHYKYSVDCSGENIC